MNYQSHNQTKSVWKTTLVIVAVLLICAGLLWLSVNFGTNKKLSSQGRDDNVGSNYYPHQSNTKPQTPHVEYDPQTGKITKKTVYDSDGTINSKVEYDRQTGKEIKRTP